MGRIRLTEGQLKAIVENSVRRIISENEEDEWGNIFTQDGRNQWKNLGNSLTAGARAGASAMRGNYQAGRDQSDLYGANANLDAEQRLRDIDNAVRELRLQYNNLLNQRKQIEAQYKNRGLATINRQNFKRNSVSALPTSTPNVGRFGNGNYNANSGNIGDLTTQGYAH